LSETLAEFLGTIGTTKELRRNKINEIPVDKAISLEELNSENWMDSIKSIEEILYDFPKITPSENEIERLKMGQRIPCKYDDIDFIMIKDFAKSCVGFAEIKEGVIHPRIML